MGNLVRPVSNVVSNQHGPHPRFDGQPVHIVQIGLGSFMTFGDRWEREIQKLLQGTTRRSDEPLTAIGVDPVNQWTERLVPLCQASDKVALIAAAVGRAPGTRFLHGLSGKARERLQASERWKQMAEEAQDLVLDQLAYLENMARLDDFHPHFQYGLDVIRREVNCGQELCEKRPVICYTFGQILDMVNASACEVLHIDAEGADCEIVESMGDFCSMWDDTQRWPRIFK